MQRLGQPHRLIVLAGVFIAWNLTSLVATAQLVVVRPGYVKAPFVRVIRNYDGSTTVRAPFVRVNSSAKRSAPAVIKKAKELPLTQMNWRQLRELLAVSVKKFDNDLSQLPTGEVWRKFFETKGSWIRSTDVRPSEAEWEEVFRLLAIYRQAMQNDDLKVIVRQESFARVLAILQQFEARSKPAPAAEENEAPQQAPPEEIPRPRRRLFRR